MLWFSVFGLWESQEMHDEGLVIFGILSILIL